MGHGRLGRLVGALLVVSALPMAASNRGASAVTQAASEPDCSSLSPGRVADLRALLIGLGFDSEAASVESLLKTPEGCESLDRLGVPLVGASRLEFEQRLAMQHSNDAVLATAAKMTGFAGSNINHRAGGLLELLFTREVDANEIAALRNAVAPAFQSRLRVKTVDTPLASLDALAEKLARASEPSLQLGGIPVRAIGTDIAANGLLTVVATEDERRRLEPVVSELEAKYNEPIRVDVVDVSDRACSSRDWCVGPQRAGTTIYPPSSAAPICSEGPHVFGPGGVTLVLTAGHCHYSAGWQQWTHGIVPSVWIGTPYSSLYSPYGYDAVTIGMPAGDHSNQIYRSGPSSVLYASGVMPEPSTGALICKTGRSSGYSCGYINGGRTYYVSSTTGWTVIGVPVTAMSSAGGDSGGAVVDGGFPSGSWVRVFGLLAANYFVVPTEAMTSGMGLSLRTY